MTTKLIVIYRERYSRFNDATGSYGPGDVEVALVKDAGHIQDDWIVCHLQTVTFDETADA